ncbi:D-alanine--D-alanine ligase family protein [Blochmannia endosymbiont of Polyrhachis (Hedomyrma) turneri]|uniref:D-alanine--D-alanine ligase family protein n=1 Tax=Blochmannia endosymbiont of Polyrhachis (Hedomyrma) turneri TaxID=1505596 RepID=UPI00061A7AAA|nr:D-alanine--D-alanine ligase family protein [Blochmannia endosymbiont of Polyrhachis (Hedomyrma) turneri]AKC60036.1 D-alanine-D-alanine ligase A [Blochmannia endosymbiont of Polyrhachis (Hedomyrma) turneri]
MSKLHVGIVFGGVSLEHDISLQSAKNIACVIDQNRFTIIMIFVDKKGIWHREDMTNKISFSKIRGVIFDFYQYFKYRLSSSISQCESCVLSRCFSDFEILSGLDVVFPIIHGGFGEDGSLQGLLKIKKIPFVGSGVLGSAISMDKDITKRLLHDAGLMVAPFVTLTESDEQLDFEYYADVFGLPFFVKPACQGSSIGTSKVFNRKDFCSAINLAFSLDYKVLIEAAIVGRELECAVLGNNDLRISVCGEILLDKNTFYTYQNKYQECVEIVIPAKISHDVSDKIYSVVLRAFRVLQCWGMARVDFFLTSDFRVIINEVNTLPGFAVTSMYPKLWEASGLNSKDLVTILIELALESREDDKKRIFS